jgi:hypothetical protein
MTRINPFSIALSGWIVFCAAFVMLFPSDAHADCKEWDLGSGFFLNQTNGYQVQVYITERTGTQFRGSAGYFYPDSEGVATGVKGPLEGSIIGNTFSFTVHWETGTLGDYTGTISPQGWVAGETKDRMHPENTARWTSDPDSTLNRPPARCLDVAAPPAPAAPPPKEVKKLGKRLPGTSTTSDLPQSLFATAKDEVNIYEGPGGQFNVLQCQGGPCTMKQDDKAKVLDHHQDGWYRLQLNVAGGSGWVAEDHLTVSTK